MPKKKEDMSAAEREKMLARLADMRAKVQENKKLKAEAMAGGSSETPPSKPNAEIFAEGAKIQIKKPAPKKHEDEVLSKLDKVASHLEELASYKKEKVKAKKQKEEEAKVKEEIKTPAPEPVAAAPPTHEFQVPRSYGTRFFQGGRF